MMNYYPKNLNAANYKNLDFFISHGSVDQVLPVDWGRKAKPFLDKLNIKNSIPRIPCWSWCGTTKFLCA